MTLAIAGIIVGLILLVWSADRFVEGAANAAGHFGMSPLLIGMLILGFGTSAPEIVISTLSSMEGKSNLALGNAIGSNIANIALILGFTALILPITVHSKILKKELPVLTGIALIAGYQLSDNHLSRMDGIVLLVLFGAFLIWTVYEGMRHPKDALSDEVVEELEENKMPVGKAFIWLFIGLIVLVASSRLLVWSAVEIATFFNVSELVIGLTVVAIGTSLPELASSVAAARKGEDDIAIGNVIGSNLFNTLAVMGLAGTIHPVGVDPEVFTRDTLFMVALTVSLFFFGFGFRKKHGKITRIEGAILMIAYGGYTYYLLETIKA
ncbi:MAG: calcium/sodium antiporter [Bacteriovoracaceae bacterium]|nr:calcium/sodium antiporter [Bacteriovoracaceae bacterium]